MLRKVLTTTATGEGINTTISGTTVAQSISYIVHLQVNNAADLTNLRLVAFIAETEANVIIAAEGPLTVIGADAKITLTALINGAVFCTATTVPDKVILKNTGPVTRFPVCYSISSGRVKI